MPNTPIRLTWMIALACGWMTPAAGFAEPPGQEIRLAWEPGKTGSKASFRGISAVSPDCIWLSGSGTVVLRSTDGGDSWSDVRPSGFDGVDFRCVHAFSNKKACLASSGTPAVILRTSDGGQTWREAYRNDAETAFFDCMRFWDDRNGIAVSDPVGERLLIVQTIDGGHSWKPLSIELVPKAREGEAAFAASNTSLCTGPGGQFWLGTGGSQATKSRVYHRSKFSEKVSVLTVPMPSGPAEGIFSFCKSDMVVICVGGDYRADQTSKVTALISADNGTTWKAPSTPPPAFRSCVVPLTAKFGGGFLCVGPTGSEVSDAAGEVWRSISNRSLHAIAITQDSVFASGADGAFARLKILQ
jgi:photosystem II stability/assembly factor-like uncharacterized protein